MQDCPFCQIIVKKITADVVFEDKKVLVMLDIDDAVKGHLLVIWKEHLLNSSDLREADYLHFSQIFHRSEKIILALTQKKRALVLKTGGLVSHFHFHIYPVDLNTSWEEIKNIFDKKVRYHFKRGEKEQLIRDLSKNLQLIR